MSSPTQRSLKLLRDRGYRAEVVERRKGPVSVDLFGFIDIVAIRAGETLAVQTTGGINNMHARIRKIEDSEALDDVRKAGWAIHVHGWRKLKSGWACREVDVS